MRKNLQDFRENHGDTARIVLFQLAAVTADYFLLWPRRNASTTKMVVNGACALLVHGIAYKAAKHLETSNVQLKETEASKAEARKEDKETQIQSDTNSPTRPATP